MQNFIVENLDWVALVLGTIGSLLWARNGAWAKYSTLWWLASSLLWVVVSYLKGLPAVGARDMIAIAINLYGMWRWFGKPAIANAATTTADDGSNRDSSTKPTTIIASETRLAA